MFKPIKNLASVNYLMLLKNKEDKYYNEELNKIFDRNNKQYGNNIKIDDNTKKNNIFMIAIEIKKELNKVEPDDDKVINSLVKFLYSKPSSRKKKLLWYIYGEQLYNNLSNNIDHKNYCLQCGKRTDEELINGKCLECRQKEMKNLKGKKKVKCIDCGEEILVTTKDTKTCRCKQCYDEYRKKYWRENKRKNSTDQN